MRFLIPCYVWFESLFSNSKRSIVTLLKIPLYVYLNSGIEIRSPHRVLFISTFCDLPDEVCCVYRKSISEQGCYSPAVHTHQRNRKNKTEEKINYALKKNIYIMV